MANKVVMPKLSDTMEEGVIVQWHKKEGDVVSSGDILAEIETDKAIVELQSFANGILRKILVPEEGKAPVGKLIAIIGKADEDISAILHEAEQQPESKPIVSEPVREPAKTEAEQGQGRSGKIIASPLAKRLAEEAGLDLTLVTGTGPDGRITEKDVKQYLAEHRAQPAIDYTEQELSPMWKALARKMVESKSPVPQFYVTVEIEMDEVLKTKRAMAEITPQEKVTITDILVKAVAKTLEQHPEINVSYANGNIRTYNHINVGIAVALDDGLIVPVIKDADKKPLLQIAKETKELIQKAKTRTIHPTEYSGSTFTISNLGMFPVSHFIAIVPPPESAILAVGTIQAKPVVKDGQIVIRQIMAVTLSCDHRVIDGARAAIFLKDLKQRLEQPTKVFS
ncbi:MAG: 2-oxo acid dehydrogenase subunit E2 [bacterium]|nr:2-oxo acid dehydrogenase subunit E2 [bacterium]